MEMAFLESTMRSGPMSFQEQGLDLQVITNRGGNGAAGAAAAASETPWWAGAGSQLLIGGESFGQSSHVVMEDSRHHQILAARRQARCFMYPGPAMPPEGSVVKFPIISGNSDLGKDLKFHEPPAPTVSSYPGLLESQGHFELALGQSMQRAKMLLPSVIAADGPIYVNAKQFNAIVRRRLARAKAGTENKVSRNSKPYRHESRHLHAMRRARGSSGRFLAKNLSGEQANAGGPPTWSTNTPPSSEGPDSNDNYSEGTSVSPARENLGDFHAVGEPLLSPTFFPALATMVDGGGASSEAKWPSGSPRLPAAAVAASSSKPLPSPGCPRKAANHPWL